MAGARRRAQISHCASTSTDPQHRRQRSRPVMTAARLAREIPGVISDANADKGPSPGTRHHDGRSADDLMHLVRYPACHRGGRPDFRLLAVARTTALTLFALQSPAQARVPSASGQNLLHGVSLPHLLIGSARHRCLLRPPFSLVSMQATPLAARLATDERLDISPVQPLRTSPAPDPLRVTVMPCIYTLQHGLVRPVDW